MKVLPMILLIFSLLTTSVSVNAQYYGAPFAMKVGKLEPAIDVVSGNVETLRTGRKINIVYDYSHTTVGEFNNEQDYINKKVAEYNEKNPEKAQGFVDTWYNSRKERYEPKFEEQLNIHLSKTGMYGQNYTTDGEFTLYVITVRTEPGFHAGVAKRPAYIDAECVFTDSYGTEILRFVVKNATGSQAANFDFDTGSRLAESYAKCGKMLGKEITGQLGY